MKSSSQESVRSLFNLPSTERIYDDFGCAIAEYILYHGRLFLTENYICFNSSILNDYKCIIPFKEIKEVKHTQSQINLITTNMKKPKVTFTSFTNISIAYKRIKMICRAYLKKISMSLDRKSILINSIADISIILSDSENQSSDTEISKAPRTESINLIEERKNSIFPHMELQQKAEVAEAEEVLFSPLAPEAHQALRVVVNKPPIDFFEKFFKNAPESSFNAFYLSLEDHFDLNITDWTKVENPAKETFERKISFSIKLTGVPFINQSDVKKNQTYTIDKETNIITIKGLSESVGVPYCNYFTIEDTIEIYPYMNNTKCIIRASVIVNFLKSTFLKSTITATSKSEFQKEMDKWVEFAKKQNETVEEYVPILSKRLSYSLTKHKENKLQHGVENIVEIVNKGKNYEITRLSENTKNIIIYILLFLLIITVIMVLHTQKHHTSLLHQQNDLLKQLLLNQQQNNIDIQKPNSK